MKLSQDALGNLMSVFCDEPISTPHFIEDYNRANSRNRLHRAAQATRYLCRDTARMAQEEGHPGLL
jgi:hypothetical protein